MTKRKENILRVSGQLFASKGFSDTSTSLIAKKSKVSEGLIFRHFGNKRSLLEALMKSKAQFFSEQFRMATISEPKAFLSHLIETVQRLNINSEMGNAWLLTLKMSVELGQKQINPLQALQEKLATCFLELRYKNPSFEAELFMKTLNGYALDCLLFEAEDREAFANFLKFKYGI